METEKLPPPCLSGRSREAKADGEEPAFNLPLVGRSANAVSRVGGSVDACPPPEMTSLRSVISTSPQGGGEEIIAHARSWIGTPYVHQASVKGAGCDCLGLLRGVWRELHGDEPEDIPPYRPHWNVRGSESLRDGLARHLAPVALTEIAAGDVLLFRMMPRAPARHCAILAEQDGGPTLIHARQNKRVSEEPFTPAWRKKLAYAFRL